MTQTATADLIRVHSEYMGRSYHVLRSSYEDKRRVMLELYTSTGRKVERKIKGGGYQTQFIARENISRVVEARR